MMYTRRRLFVGLGLLLLAHVGRADDFSLDITTGYQLSNLRWNIGVPGINILSELTWSQMHAAAVSLDARWEVAPRLELTGSGSLGRILDGRNQDSDYNLNDREDEFSRSVNSADDSLILGLDAKLGYRIPVPGPVIVRPSAGILLRQQRLRMTDGQQVIPAIGPFANLDSRYVATWLALALGVDFGVSIDGVFGVAGSVAYAPSRYRAWANWNLRTDLAHPRSFKHYAFGNGVLMAVQVEIPLKSDLTLLVGGNYELWWTQPGEDRLFLANGLTSDAARLNEVRFWSLDASIGLSIPLGELPTGP